MIISNKKYIVEVDLKDIGKAIAKGAVIGSALFGGIVTAGKMAGVGRFAPQPIETQNEPTQQSPVEQIPNTISQTNQNSEIKQNTQIKQTSPKVEEVKQHEFQNEHIKRLYGAIVHAEHRGHVTDPYAYNKNLSIRTRSGGGASSSYGPLQMNTSVSGFLDKSDPYHSAFLNQLKKMNKTNKNHETYGLGKQGDLSGSEHHAAYQKMGEKVIIGKLREALGKSVDISKPLTKDQLNRFITHWNVGLGSGKTPEKWYSNTIQKHYYGQ
jgi:hypothetical protein